MSLYIFNSFLMSYYLNVTGKLLILIFILIKMRVIDKMKVMDEMIINQTPRAYKYSKIYNKKCNH